MENLIIIIKNMYYLISSPGSLVKLIISGKALIKRLLPIVFASWFFKNKVMQKYLEHM